MYCKIVHDTALALGNTLRFRWVLLERISKGIMTTDE